MHSSRVRVVSWPIVFGGWKGELTFDGDVVRIDGGAGGRSVEINIGEVTRASFNSSNGLWAMRCKSGRRIRFQSAGGLLSADRTAAGRETNDQLWALLRKHKVKHFSV
ncbi:hypothetical protein [Kribbella sp. NPDC051620]|uniref:hypothetical protein n=1 Tax=Kribbella sp. NPDC051620 TaxID=3364120 RepID=UPI0037A37F61